MVVRAFLLLAGAGFVASMLLVAVWLLFPRRANVQFDRRMWRYTWPMLRHDIWDRWRSEGVVFLACALAAYIFKDDGGFQGWAVVTLSGVLGVVFWILIPGLTHLTAAPAALRRRALLTAADRHMRQSLKVEERRWYQSRSATRSATRPPMPRGLPRGK